MQTQVAIIGGGPAGSLLSLLLANAGIDSVVIERQSREHVLSRIRAGVLEWGSVETLRAAGLGERLDLEGHVHNTINIAWRSQQLLSIDTHEAVGRRMMGYGQTKIQEDLYAAADARGAQMVFGVEDVEIHGVETDSPRVMFTANGDTQQIDCDFVAGCDGFHGVSRHAIPESKRKEFHKEYPFGWLGILSETPPLPNLVYANSERGFALCSLRNPMLSRYYVQCPLTDVVDDWSDDRFWSELLARLPDDLGAQIQTGPSIEKSIAPLRSFVSEPISWGRLHLCGDAAHIVPPTGAKGLNLAFSDVYYLSRAMTAHYAGDPTELAAYGETALRRVWGAVRFSWWLTTLLHRFPDQSDFDQRTQEQELDFLSTSLNYQASMCEQYVGFPL